MLTAFNLCMLRQQPQRAVLLGLMFLPELLAAGLQVRRNAGLLPTNFWATDLWELTALVQMPFAAVVVMLQVREEQQGLSQAEPRDRERQDFLNLMAHELRTVLARQNLLVDRDLGDSRLRDGSLRLALAHTRPSELVARLRPLPGIEAPHRLRLALPDDDSPLRLDARRLELAVINLLDDAV